MARARSARKARKSRAIKKAIHKKRTTATVGGDGSAAAKVFGTVELLEAILKHLPMKDLLGAHCVSRGFHDTIKDSISLQRQLFLKPVENGEYPRTSNPLLIARPEDSCLITLTSPSFEHSRALVNGWTYSFRRGFEDDSIWISRFPHPGKCANMYLTQPPIKHVAIWIYGLKLQRLTGEEPEDAIRGGCGWARMHRRGVIEKERGITWGDVCRAITSLKAEFLRDGDQRANRVADMAAW